MFKSIATVLAAALTCLAAPSHAQQPGVPPLIRIVVPFAAGGSTDVLARSVATQLGTRLATTVIIENRAGGGGLIGAGVVAKGPKDGSMLMLTTASLITAAATAPSPPLDVGTDLIPVGRRSMVLAVSTKTDIKTPADLVAAARAKPDTITHGTAGVGSISHLTAEVLNDAAKIQTKHIPYKESSQAVIDLASGTIDMMVEINTSVAPQIKAGRVRLIGVTTKDPNPSFPGVLPVASAVPGFDVSFWVVCSLPPGPRLPSFNV
jgi:tripartite-type tricarboxylate transporter receptor subunit TctC